MFQPSGGGEGGADLPLPGAGGCVYPDSSSPELCWMLSQPEGGWARGDVPTQGHCSYKAQPALASPHPQLLIMG